MPPLRFIHAADLHLDSPFRGLAEVAPALQKVLRDATLQAFDNVIDLCLNRHVDCLLIAGDVYDAGDRSLRAITRLRRSFERLGDIPVFMCCHPYVARWFQETLDDVSIRPMPRCA